MRGGPLFDYHRVLAHINRQKQMVLDGVPRYLQAPGSLMPRNYVSGDDQCTIRFSNSTNYPWMTALVTPSGASFFPPFTPFASAQATYHEHVYDDTQVELRRDGNEYAEPPSFAELNASKRMRFWPDPALADYVNSISPDDVMQYRPLSIPANLQQSARESRNAGREMQNICGRTTNIVYQVDNSGETFFEPNRNNVPSPYVPSDDVTSMYRHYLQNAETMDTTPLLTTSHIPHELSNNHLETPPPSVGSQQQNHVDESILDHY